LKGIKVNRYLETNIKDIYAMETAEQREAIDERRPIEAVWYTGRMMGSACANTNRKAYAIQTGTLVQFRYFRHRIPNLRMGFAKQLEHEIQFIGNIKTVKKAIRISFHKESRQF
jgi:hypothetical protein